jgi:hypothetical protein
MKPTFLKLDGICIPLTPFLERYNAVQGPMPLSKNLLLAGFIDIAACDGLPGSQGEFSAVSVSSPTWLEGSHQRPISLGLDYSKGSHGGEYT